MTHPTIHCFADASQQAFGAVVFFYPEQPSVICHSESPSGTSEVNNYTTPGTHGSTGGRSSDTFRAEGNSL